MKAPPPSFPAQSHTPTAHPREARYTITAKRHDGEALRGQHQMWAMQTRSLVYQSPLRLRRKRAFRITRRCSIPTGSCSQFTYPRRRVCAKASFHILIFLVKDISLGKCHESSVLSLLMETSETLSPSNAKQQWFRMDPNSEGVC